MSPWFFLTGCKSVMDVIVTGDYMHKVQGLRTDS